ncbi:MAG: hypothetical protein JRH07_11160, partial [Deltaproteobacteria bacterium]|nr:hypothetical protein [Deltaproteobacteria bacterium]
MKRRDRLALWAAAIASTIVVLFLALIILLPRLINLQPVREKILGRISHAVGGRVELERMDLFLFPRPGVIARGVSLSIPGIIGGTLRSAGIYPEILPLFAGRLQISRIEIRSPDFTAALPDKPQEKPKKHPPPPVESVKQKVGHLLAVLTSKVPGLAVRVSNGKLRLSRGGRPAARFEAIEARIDLPPNRLKVNLGCTSNLWESMSFTGFLDPENLGAAGQLALVNFKAHE